MNFPIRNGSTPDPWMIKYGETFYLTCTQEYKIEIWASSQMEDFREPRKSLIWEPRPTDSFIINIWAPELHRINSTWYIYFTAAHPDRGKASHRTLVLRSTDLDPMVASSWEYLGPIQNMPDRRQLDSTVFGTQSGLYCSYSGWPANDNSDMEQYLYLVQLKSPEEALPETLTCISRPELHWERFADGERGINTAPTFLSTRFFTGLVYSASCSWSHERKLAILYLQGDPLQVSSWTKRPTPLLVDGDTPPFGPGQASFLRGPTDDSVFCVYHAQARKSDHWHRRQARVLPLFARDFEMDAESVSCAEVNVDERLEQSGARDLPPDTVF